MRHSIVIHAKNRDQVVELVKTAPSGTRFELIHDPRTNRQNQLMWCLLSEIATKVEHCGNHYDAEAWKCAFLKEMGKRMQFMPALDGEGVVAVGYRSSHLTKEEFSDLLERICQYAAEHGVETGDAA
jgi:hypothetical protein